MNDSTGNVKNAFVAISIIVAVYSYANSQEQKTRNIAIEPPHISTLYPELEEYNDLIRYYKPAYFARLDHRGYEKPDIDEWVSTLEPFDNPALDDAFIKVWYKGDKARFIYIQRQKTRGGAFYSIGRNSIEKIGVGDYKISLFVTPVGVVKWEYIYKDNLLFMEKSYAFDFNMDGYVSCDRLWGYKKYVYWEDSRVPKHQYVYGYYELGEDDWYQRIDYDEGGNRIRRINAGPKADDPGK